MPQAYLEAIWRAKKRAAYIPKQPSEARTARHCAPCTAEHLTVHYGMHGEAEPRFIQAVHLVKKEGGGGGHIVLGLCHKQVETQPPAPKPSSPEVRGHPVCTESHTARPPQKN